MFSRHFSVSLCSAVLASTCLTAAAQQLPSAAVELPQASAVEPSIALGAVDGLLLLKNGETLAGSISRSGDYYLVVTPQAELQVRTREAEAICRDLEEVFTRKLALLNSRSADAHLGLAQWCIDRELYGYAAQELVAAYRIDDLHPRIALLERRLKAARAAPRELPQPAKPAVPAVSDEELDRAVSGVSAESLHEFTVRVQPLLMNYCATAGCHGPRRESKFHLERAYLNERTDPRVVKLNLAEVLKQVDRKTPSSSKLLTVPITPHGGAKRPIFHAHNSEHFRMMASWVGRLSSSADRSAVAAPATTAASSTGTLSQRLPLAPPSSSNPHPPATSSENTGATAPAKPASPAVAPRQGIDPFDPAEFNGSRASVPSP